MIRKGSEMNFVQVWAGVLLIREFLPLVLFAGVDVVLLALIFARTLNHISIK